jgi:hypothetical protein
MPKRLRPEKTKPTSPEKDVVVLQDSKHSEADFLRDLERATTNRSKQQLEADPSGHDPVSPKT